MMRWRMPRAANCARRTFSTGWRICALELLTGAISRDKLLQLGHLVNTRKGEVTDPRLAEILDEIDLRAQVELAKHASNPG